jgi:hypothetical protein
MTRKDFELIAATLKTHREYADDRNAVDALSEDFATRLMATNAQFDRAKFLRACGWRETPR